MWERDIRFGLGSAMIVSLWLAAAGMMVVSVVWQSREDDLRSLGILFAAAAAAYTVIRDNIKTRRVIRSLAREGLVPVREFGRRD